MPEDLDIQAVTEEHENILGTPEAKTAVAAIVTVAANKPEPEEQHGDWADALETRQAKNITTKIANDAEYQKTLEGNKA